MEASKLGRDGNRTRAQRVRVNEDGRCRRTFVARRTSAPASMSRCATSAEPVIAATNSGVSPWIPRAFTAAGSIARSLGTSAALSSIAAVCRGVQPSAATAGGCGDATAASGLLREGDGLASWAGVRPRAAAWRRQRTGMAPVPHFLCRYRKMRIGSGRGTRVRRTGVNGEKRQRDLSGASHRVLGGSQRRNPAPPSTGHSSGPRI